METFSDIKLASYSIKKEYYPEKMYVKCPDCPKLLHCSFCVQFLRRQNPHHWVGIKINEVPGCLGCEERYLRGLSEARTEVMWLRKKMGLLEMKLARQAEDIREALDLADGRAIGHPLALAFDDESTDSVKEMNVKQKTPFAIGNLDLGLDLSLGLDLDMDLDFRRAREQEEEKERRAAEMMVLKSDMEKLRDSYEVLRSKMTFLKRRAPASVASATAVNGANVCRCEGGSTSPERGDVTFVVDGREIHAHQLILVMAAAQAFESRVLRNLFDSANAVEANTCRCTCWNPPNKKSTLSARQTISNLPQPFDEPEPQQQPLSCSEGAKPTDSHDQEATLESDSVLEAQSTQSSAHSDELESGTSKDVESLQSSTPSSPSPSASPPSPAPLPAPPTLADEDVTLRGQSSKTFPWVNVRLVPSRMLEQMRLRGVRCNLIVPEEELTLSALEALEAERREKRAAGSRSEPSENTKLVNSEKKIYLSEPANPTNDGEERPLTPMQDDSAAPPNVQPITDGCEDEKEASANTCASSSHRKTSAAPHDQKAPEDEHPESKGEIPSPNPSTHTSINAPEISDRQEENLSVSKGTRNCACSDCGCRCGKEALRINADGTSFAVMEAVINCCYTADLHFSEAVQPEKVLQCAHKYAIEYVRDLCEKELCKRLNAETLPEMLKLGRNFEAPRLYLEATKFFRDNFDAVHDNVFQNFS